jgi:hypothetical protein
MPLGKGPSWSTPATLDGLRAKNWTTREGVTMRGTFSQCVARWLELHPNERQNCSIGWGPTSEGQCGFFERPNIVGFLERNGPPPDMGAHVKIEHIRNWLSTDKLPPPFIDPNDLPPSHSCPGDGGAAYRAWEEYQKTKRNGGVIEKAGHAQ